MAKRRSRRAREFRRGVSATEFALVAPVFFLFVFGLVEMGRMVMIQQCVTHAARIGCRTAILATTKHENAVKGAVRNHLQSGLIGGATVAVQVTPQLSTCTPGTQVTVDVALNYADVSWLPISFANPVIRFEAAQQRE